MLAAATSLAENNLFLVLYKFLVLTSSEKKKAMYFIAFHYISGKLDIEMAQRRWQYSKWMHWYFCDWMLEVLSCTMVLSKTGNKTEE